jgi:hypothetical protein
MSAGTRLLLAALLLPPGVLQHAHGQVNAVVFDGETYVRMHSERQSSGDRVLRFLREAETLENWTRAIGYYRYATMGNDPLRAAYALRDIIKTANPDAQARILLHTVTTDAIVDFLTWPADGRYVEFNVVRYAKSADGNGLLAFQFSHRFRDARKDYAEQFKNNRLSWRSQAVDFDMAKVQAAFGD